MTPHAAFFFFLLFVVQVADCNAAGPVVTIGRVDVSGGSHEATVGQSLTLSCNTATAVWKKGSDTISNTDTSSKVFVMSDSTETILQFFPFRTSDGGTYTCEVNSTFRTSVTLNAKLPKIQSVVVTPRYVGTSPNANPSLEVTWSAVDGPAVSYVVRYSRSMGTMTAPPDGASEMSANGNSVTLSANLAPNKKNPYTNYIWVAAISEGVSMGEYSNRTSGVTLRSPISTGVAVSPNGCQSLRVTWTPVTVTPPLTLNHYRVGFKPQGGSQLTVTTTSQGSYTLTGLAPATTYTVRVEVQTQLGYGFACCLPTATTLNVGAPRDVSLERLILQGAVRVTWSPPTDLCGLTNLQYTIQYGTSTSTPTTHPSTPSSSPFDITGLEVGQKYFVRVAVHTQSGSGTSSSWESVTTCKVGAPRMVSLGPLPTRGAVRVTWSPPTDLCGLTNPQYTIQYGKSKSTPTTHTNMPSSSPFNITGLEVGQEYFVRVAVHTQSGSGTFSSWESVTTYEVPKSVSGVMLSLTSANGGAAINVTWNAPVDDDVVIAHYEVMYEVSEHPSAGGTSTSTATTHLITGLVIGALYSVRVRAVSMEGGHAGAYSAVQSITAPVDVPAPTIMTVTGENSIFLEWFPPSEGSPLSYTVTWTGRGVTSSVVLPPTARNYTIRGLDPNTAYSSTVEVYSLANTATVSWDAHTLPQAPTNLQLVILSGASLEVKWEPATDADLSPLTYTVTAESVSVETKRVTTTPGDSSVTLSSLQEFTEYNVSVQAVNSGGSSRSLRAAVRMVTIDRSIITALEWSDDDFTSLDVSWDPVTTPQGGVITYRISYSPVMANDANMCMKEVVTSCETEGSSILLTGLDPDLFYSVMVEAIIPEIDTTTGPATDNAPLGISTVFGGVVAGVVSVVLFEVCVLGVVKWRQRIKEPAASKEKEDIRDTTYEPVDSAHEHVAMEMNPSYAIVSL